MGPDQMEPRELKERGDLMEFSPSATKGRGICGIPCCMNAGPCYSNLQERYKGKPRNI